MRGCFFLTEPATAFPHILTTDNKSVLTYVYLLTWFFMSMHFYLYLLLLFVMSCMQNIAYFTLSTAPLEDGRGKCPYDPAKGHTGLIVGEYLCVCVCVCMCV